MEEISQGDKRAAFLDGLSEAGATRVLTREENFLVIQGVLAEMLGSVIPDLKTEAEGIPESAARTNALALVEIAADLRMEMLKVVDHAMSRCKVLIVGDNEVARSIAAALHKGM